MMLPVGSGAIPASLWGPDGKEPYFVNDENAGGSDGAGVRGKNQSNKGAPPFSFPVPPSTLNELFDYRPRRRTAIYR